MPLVIGLYFVLFYFIFSISGSRFFTSKEKIMSLCVELLMFLVKDVEETMSWPELSTPIGQ